MLFIGCDSENKPVATQVPYLLKSMTAKILRGHMMKDTDHHKAFLHNENVLVVFTVITHM
ncbi:MAG: FMN-binding negative transcriptional regulator [Ignavibacteria bacterium]|nr:FMN-binding negative transcriptional regulator [Ignavibacteria bacterium]